jgi:hypothetical protein
MFYAAKIKLTGACLKDSDQPHHEGSGTTYAPGVRESAPAS